MLRNAAGIFGKSKFVRARAQGRYCFRPGLESLEDRLVLDVKNPLGALPVLNSLPSAPAKIYLDFNGHNSTDWFYLTNGVKTDYNPGNTPAFDEDGDPSTFTNKELADIQQIFARVAEDYAPFNVNVTTVDPGNFANGQALHVIIGGDPTGWKAKTAGADTSFFTSGSTGISSIGSFSDAAPNEVYVWSKLIVGDANGGYTDGDGRVIQTVPAVATTISHESGHSFGLHHSQYDANGNRVKTYDPGTSSRTPIMGDNLTSDRTTWANGPNDLGATHLQDDMAIISGSTNGFGYRAQDHGQTFSTANGMVTGLHTIFGTYLHASGIVGQTSDTDTFTFTTSGGHANITLNVAADGPNLDAKISLYRDNVINLGFFRFHLYTLVASADPSNSLGANINTVLTAGTYFVVVGSHGTYGDVGQYSLFVGKELNTIFVTGLNQTLAVARSVPTNPNPPDPSPILKVATATLAGGATAPQGSTGSVGNKPAVHAAGVSGTAALDTLFALESF